MYQGSLAPVSRREDWIVSSPLIDETGDEITLTGATIKVFVCTEGCPDNALLSGSTDDGKVTLPTTTSFQWQFTPTDMGKLCAGTYEVYLRVTISGVTTQILAASLPVTEGGPA
jgi:hypothetical protein